jgi:hypothetical protein
MAWGFEGALSRLFCSVYNNGPMSSARSPHIAGDLPPEDALPWEKLSVALRGLLGDDGAALIAREEVQRAEAALGPAYDGLDYYARQLQAVVNVLIAKGLLDARDLQARMAKLAISLAGDRDHAHPKTRFSNAGPNDIGGLPGGPIDRTTHEEAPWEKLIVALRLVFGSGAGALVNLHEQRRAVEELGDDYNRLAYFERMTQGSANVLYEKGVLSPQEVRARMNAIRARAAGAKETG